MPSATRVPIIVVKPGAGGGAVCRKPAELIDIYPTLLDLTGSNPDPLHEGQSLRPLMEDVNADWPHLARTSFGPMNVALRSERYRFIRYVDGSEELYDHQKDPHEWTNLAKDPEIKETLEKYRAQLPKEFAAVLGAGSTGHKSWAASYPRLKGNPRFKGNP